MRAKGHDVISVKETSRGANDTDVLSQAQAEQRLVITHDEDFGELAFRFGLPAECGVVLFRLSGDDPVVDNQRIVEVLESRLDWAGHFCVVDDEKVRVRSLPERSSAQDSKSI